MTVTPQLRDTQAGEIPVPSFLHGLHGGGVEVHSQKSGQMAVVTLKDTCSVFESVLCIFFQLEGSPK